MFQKSLLTVCLLVNFSRKVTHTYTSKNPDYHLYILRCEIRVYAFPADVNAAGVLDTIRLHGCRRV